MDKIINNLINNTQGLNINNNELLSLCGQFIFYTYISKKYNDDTKKLKETIKDPMELLKEKSKLTYNLKENTIFQVSGNNIKEKTDDYLTKLFYIIEDNHKLDNHKLDNYLQYDLNDKSKKILEIIISNVEPYINKDDFDLTTFLNKLLNRLSNDISITDNLIDFLKKFAYNEYNDPIKSVYDNVVGLGNLFDLNAEREYYGIEIDETIAKLCQIKMTIKNIENFTIECGNSLECGKNNENEYDLVFSDMPLGIRFNTDLINTEDDPRYKGIPPTLWKSDGLFIADALYHLNENGLCIVTCTQGLLFRPGGERDFRQYLIDNNYIDGILYLPAKVLKGANDPISFMILRKNRKDHDKIKLFELSQFFDSGDRGKPKEICKDKINEVIDIYYNNKENENFIHISKEEIERNNYDLSYSLYIKSNNSSNFDKESQTIKLDNLKTESEKNKDKLNTCMKNLINMS